MKRISPLTPPMPLVGFVDSSASEIKTWGRCKGKWALKYVLRRRKDKTGRALAFGRLAHDTLALYYNEEGTGSKQDRLKESFKLAYTQLISGSYEDPDRKLMHEAYKILRGYIGFWNPDFDFILPEINFARIPIFDQRFAGFVHGRLDGTVLIENKIWIVDHKTGKKFTPNTFELDLQIDLYSLSGIKLFGKSFGGVIINYIRSYTSGKSLNYVRTKVVRSRRELTFIEANLARTLRSMGSTTPADLPFTFTKDCTWDCDYLSVCRRLRAGQSVTDFIKKDFSLRDPEEEHIPGRKSNG